MPWQERDVESLRREFALRAGRPEVNMRALCREYDISAKTGYLWRERYQQQGEAGLSNQSRRPHTAPGQTAPTMEATVVAMRTVHPAWGGRKIAARLEALGQQAVPSPSTITAILRRHGLLVATPLPRDYQRWEREAPNALWQMDFKGAFATAAGQCHPLTMLDDHSRFALCLAACRNQQGTTVQGQLTRVFGEYGLPEAILCDNGSPWGSVTSGGVTALTVWLLRAGVRVGHGRAYHPQTQGKEERFHRTLKAEVLRGQEWDNHAACQKAFDVWRQVYNGERPHEAVGMQPPATRYQASKRVLPDPLPCVEYNMGETVRRVRDGGRVTFRGRQWRVGGAFDGYPVAIRGTETDGVFGVYFLAQGIAQIDLRDPLCESASVEDVLAQV